MKVGKGIVKKYSREYNRTLKNGQIKKYTTEQIQITIAKNEDIYENKEEVLIIPNSEIKEFKNMEEENETLKIANYLHVEEVDELERQLEENNNQSTFEYEQEIEGLKTTVKEQEIALSEMEEKYNTHHINTLNTLKQENETIKEKNSKLTVENENLKSECLKLKEEGNSLRESYHKLSVKHDHLKQENLNTKTGYAEIYETNENLEKEYDTLRLEYNDLVDRYNELQEELYNIKSHHSRDEYLAHRVKEFMLKRY